MVFLVVLIHAGGVYESSGAWALFWIVDDPATNHLSGILFLILDIFVMPTIFFISGFLVPLSIRNKPGWTFLRSKFKRLMVPWIIAVLTLIPIYKMIFLYSRNIPQESWASYFHWNAMWSQNWLWFLPVLFLFNVLYMLLARLCRKSPPSAREREIFSPGKDGEAVDIGFIVDGAGCSQVDNSGCLDPIVAAKQLNNETVQEKGPLEARATFLTEPQGKCLPGRISIKFAIGAIFIIGFANSLGMDMLEIRGWTKTVLLDFHNERLLIYLMTFLLGSLCFGQKVFAARPKGIKLYITANSSAWIPVSIYISFLLIPVFKPGSSIISPMADRVIVWLAFHVSLLCFLYLSVETFRRYLDRPGRILNELSRNSYFVYIIHVIVMGVIALVMLNTAIPSLLKFLILTVATFGLSNLLICFYRTLFKSRIVNSGMEESTMKTVTTAMLIVTLLSVAGCTKQEDSDKERRPPSVGLHVAALQGNLDAIRQHVDAGSDLDEKDAYGSSPLIIAATFGKTEVAGALIDAGADLTITNNEGATPLHIAAFFCRTEIVKALLDKGADRTIRNNAGRTALETVAVPFDDVKGLYHGIGKGLKPLGLKLDYERIRTARPKIAQMLR